MELKPFISKKRIVEVIAILFILLFVFASITKLRNMKNFQEQIGQSPMLSVFADEISWGVIGLELLATGLISFQNTRKLGLYLSFGLMAIFTTYILLVLNFSDNIPCSCGGVISSMGWYTHTVFNILFMGLAIVGLFLMKNNDDINQYKELRSQEKPKT